YYCHLASRNVNEGQTVKRLDKLGVMGNTGYSFGAHLHFEVREADGKTAVSPENILGIPNKSGRYTLSQLDEDIMTLYKNGVVKTPEYWEKNASKMRFVPELLHNMAERLE
ncbi:MAG: M23 family metallopeptidase, partial [Clostridia bacterium]|nr:M23 family metallopeptidase [Clostridia bacterium]